MKTIGITRGDQAGINEEIIDLALKSEEIPKDCKYLLIGGKISSTLGKPNQETAKIALSALKESITLWKQNKIDALITTPISKYQLQQIGFPYLGHTEFYAKETKTSDYAMCFVGKHFTTALVTSHLPLKEISKQLSNEKIVNTGKLLSKFLQQQGINKPKIAVCGLNPHSGEQGLLGKEEKEIIAPAIIKLNKNKEHHFYGTFPPDTLFIEKNRRPYDAILAMYHDQALIPFKMLNFDTGVNITLGLPFPRLSPDHGPAYDIAGKGKANPSSLIASIKLASKLVKFKRTPYHKNK